MVGRRRGDGIRAMQRPAVHAQRAGEEQAVAGQEVNAQSQGIGQRTSHRCRQGLPALEDQEIDGESPGPDPAEQPRLEGCVEGGGPADGTDTDRAEQQPVPSDTPGGSRATLLRIQAFIDRHLADPDLTSQAIAQVHRISVRYLHKLFESEDATVGRWIERRRLEECRCDLARHGNVANEVSRRAPSRDRASCGALRAHCPIGAYERAPAMTADVAISRTATNGCRRPRR